MSVSSGWHKIIYEVDVLDVLFLLLHLLQASLVLHHMVVQHLDLIV